MIAKLVRRISVPDPASINVSSEALTISVISPTLTIITKYP
jgi:hypothetical protein